jgi:hypothetical protein
MAALFLWKESLHIFAECLQSPTSFSYAIVISIWVKALKYVIGYISNSRVHLQPVVKGIVLRLIEPLKFLALK